MRKALPWVVVVVVGIAIFLWLLPNSPTYGGRSVHSWIKDLGKSGASDAQDRTRAKATEALLEMGPAAVPALVNACFLKENSLDTSLDWLDSHVPEVLARIMPERPDRSSIRQYSMEALIALGPDARQAVPKLQAAYLAPKKDVTEQFETLKWAEAILAARGKEDPASRSFFIDWLNSPDGEVVFCAVFALGEIGSPAVPAVPRLIELLDVENDRIQWRAAKTLGQIGVPASSALPALRKLMLNEAAYLDARVAAASSVWKIIGETNQCLPILTAALSGGGLWADVQAAVALGEMGRSAQPALPALLETLNSSSRRNMEELFKVRVAEAIWRIDSNAEVALPTLERALLHGQREAFEVVGTLGAAARPAVPQLLVALQGKDQQARESAAKALGNIGVDAETVPALATALSDEFIAVRLGAAEALAKIDPHNDQLARALEAWPKTGGVHTRRRAAEILNRIDTGSRDHPRQPRF